MAQPLQHFGVQRTAFVLRGPLLVVGLIPHLKPARLGIAIRAHPADHSFPGLVGRDHGIARELGQRPDLLPRPGAIEHVIIVHAIGLVRQDRLRVQPPDGVFNCCVFFALGHPVSPGPIVIVEARLRIDLLIGNARPVHDDRCAHHALLRMMTVTFTT